MKTVRSSDKSRKVEKAMEFAKKKHAFQMRRDGKTLYWVHLEQVVNNLLSLGIKDYDILCAGWLHDTIEDTNTDFDDIRENFGLQVAEIVSQVTKDKRLPRKEREGQYLRNLANASWSAQVIKLSDILANLTDLSNSPDSVKKKQKQVADKLQYFEAIRKGLASNKDKIPKLNAAIKQLNDVSSRYHSPIDDQIF